MGSYGSCQADFLKAGFAEHYGSALAIDGNGNISEIGNTNTGQEKSGGNKKSNDNGTRVKKY